MEEEEEADDDDGDDDEEEEDEEETRMSMAVRVSMIETKSKIVRLLCAECVWVELSLPAVLCFTYVVRADTK